MYYRAPNTQYLQLTSNEEMDFDAGDSCLLIPPSDSKIFLHWIVEHKILATATLSHPLLVKHKLKIINASTHNTCVTVIKTC